MAIGKTARRTCFKVAALCGRVALGAGVTAGLFASALAVPARGAVRPATVTAHGSPSCQLVSSALVKAALGITAGAPVSSQPFPGEIRCDMKVGSNKLGIQVVFNEDFSASNFKSEEQAYVQSGFPKVAGVGEYAYATSEHTTGISTSALSGYTKSGTEVSLGAAGIAFSKVEALAKKVVAALS